MQCRPKTIVLILHDVDPAVTKAYRLSRCPIHLLSNHEHENMRIIQMLRNTKPNLNAMDLGGPLYQTRIPVWCDGQMRYVPLCEAPNCTLSRHIADSVKGRMIISLALLVVSIVHRSARAHANTEWNNLGTRPC